MRLVRAIIIAALLVYLLPAVAYATDKGETLRYGGGGLGTVLFDGRIHTGKGYVCRDCHDDLFVTQKKARVRMSDHFTDKSCFKCHNNTDAPKDCFSCHRDVPSSGLVGSDFMRGSMAQEPANEEERNVLLTGRGGVSAQTRACLSCHGDSTLKSVSERGKTLNLLVDRPAYGVGAHGVLPCAACHYGTEGEKSFTQQPHAQAPTTDISCKSCHSQQLAAEVAAFDSSLHMQKAKDKFSCMSCHNVHSQAMKKNPPLYEAAVAQYNSACLSCHGDAETFLKYSDKPLDVKAMEHSFMVKFDAHKNTILCSDCHTPMGEMANKVSVLGADPHKNLEKAQALRDCSTCHTSMDSLIVERIAARDGNIDALNGKYIPGQKASDKANSTFGWFFMGVLGLLLLHGIGRMVAKKHISAGEVVSTYVYPLPIRIFHWINAIGFIILFWTGFGIHFANMSLEQISPIHSCVGYVLIANFVLFLLYGIGTGDIKQYLPGAISDIFVQAKYYLVGIFTGAEKPFAISKEHRFNPLQQITYLVVFIIGMPIMIISGILLVLPESSTIGIAPRETLAQLHFCLAFCYALFLLIHLYLITTGPSIWSLLKGMITGWHEEKK